MKQKQKHKHKSLPVPSAAKKVPPADKKRRLIFWFIVGALGFLLYTNTLSNGYVLDDFSAVKENNIVRQGMDAIPEIFKTSYRQGYLSVKDGLYRPLTLAMFAIEWDLFPDQPSVSHFINIVLYGITGILLFFFLFRMAPFGPAETRKNELFAFIASLIYIVHPLHVEVTANIKSRDEIVCFLLVICSFLAVFKFIDTGAKKFLAYGVFAYFLSLLAKETSITFLALLPLALLFFTNVPLKRNVLITLAFAAGAGIYLMIRSSVLEGALSDDTVSMADNILVGAKTFSTRMGTAFYIMGLYLKLHFFPHPLSYDYSYNHIPIVGLENIFSIFSILAYCSIGFLAALILFQSLKDKHSVQANTWNRSLAFGIFFFLITLFLFSNLVLTIGTSMGDRLMYFPSLGICICIALLYIKFFTKEAVQVNPQNWKLYPIAALLLLFSYKTRSRNYDWKDNYTLYSHDVQLVPNSVKAHYYLGLELVKVQADAEADPEKKKKIYGEGIKELERAVEIMPYFASAYTQMGVAYYRLQNYEKAIENYTKAAELRPMDAITLNNIGTVYFEWKKYSEAKEQFQKALQADPRFVDAHMNLGSVCGQTGDFPNAIASFQEAIRWAPDNARAYYFIAITYQNMGDMPNADKYFRIAERMDPKLKKQ